MCILSTLADYGLPTPAPSSIMAIPVSNQGTTLVTLPSTSVETSDKKLVAQSSISSGQSSTTFIAYSPIKEQSHFDSQNHSIQLIKSSSGNYMIASPQGPANHSVSAAAGSATTKRDHTSVPTMTAVHSMDAAGPTIANLADLQRQEVELKLREAKLRCEVQEIEKEKAKEELIQMREIHRMKIKEMELRLRNIERT